MPRVSGAVAFRLAGDVVALSVEGLTQSQIAARLEVPLGTVKTRAFHAMRALRAALARRGFDPAA